VLDDLRGEHDAKGAAGSPLEGSAEIALIEVHGFAASAPHGLKAHGWRSLEREFDRLACGVEFGHLA
jgi:hypothetical protein